MIDDYLSIKREGGRPFGLRPTLRTASPFKVGLGILQIISAKRCPQVWPWVGRSLFSTNFVEFDQAV